MATSTGSGRLVSLSPDNHQPWLWFVHILTLLTTALAVSGRARYKRTFRGISDVVLFVAHLLYFAFWMVLLFAVINNVGKSSRITSISKEMRASKLVLSSRILLVGILTLEKLSTVFLIREIFTKAMTKLWSYVIASLSLCQLIIGSLVISVGCSPGRTIFPGNEGHCPERPTRWIAFTVLEALLDLLLLVPVIRVVLSLQMSFQNKLWAMAVFVSRCVVWVPCIVHLVYFIRYIDHGRDIIDIVPTIVTEEIWVCTALILSSVPVLLRVTKKFTTLGVQIAESTIYQGSTSKSKENSRLFTSKGSGRQGPSKFEMKNVTVVSRLDMSGQRTLRPAQDDGLNIVQIDARAEGEGASIGSVPGSQIGILRQTDFDVHSESE